MTADRLGIEIETDLIPLANAQRMLQQYNIDTFQATRDASCEFPGHLTRGKKLILSRVEKSSKTTLGSEFVSVPMNIEQFKTSVRNMTMVLRSMGESHRSRRSSIHIHIECIPHLQTMKNALNLFESVEPLFYRLGGMGYDFRGIYNNSIYCRPVTNPFGPPVVLAEDGAMYQLFCPEDLKNADSIEKFWYIMGINPERIERYHPARYFGLNLFSLILHGTMEYRFFNKTLSHQSINAVAALCQATTELMIRSKDLGSPVSFSKEDDMGRLSFLQSLIERTNKDHFLRDRDIVALETIITTTECYSIQEKYTKSHLFEKWNLQAGFLRSYKRRRVQKEEVIDSGFIDIHNIGSKNFDFLESMS